MSTRDERIETYYHQSAWDLAERIVDLEDQAVSRRAEVLREALAAVEDPEQRRAATGRDALGWESARDVISRLIRMADEAEGL